MSFCVLEDLHPLVGRDARATPALLYSNRILLSRLFLRLAGASLLFSLFLLTACGNSGVANKVPAVNSLPTTSTSNAGNSAHSFSNVQSSGGWGQFGQGPPSFVDCSPSPCDGITF